MKYQEKAEKEDEGKRSPQTSDGGVENSEAPLELHSALALALCPPQTGETASRGWLLPSLASSFSDGQK